MEYYVQLVNEIDHILCVLSGSHKSCQKKRRQKKSIRRTLNRKKPQNVQPFRLICMVLSCTWNIPLSMVEKLIKMTFYLTMYWLQRSSPCVYLAIGRSNYLMWSLHFYHHISQNVHYNWFIDTNVNVPFKYLRIPIQQPNDSIFQTNSCSDQNCRTHQLSARLHKWVDDFPSHA